MKKIIVLSVVLFFTIIETNAQDFNKWSIDLGAGVHILSLGHRTSSLDFWQANVGGRYMVNEKFGLRLDFGFNQFTEDNVSESFNTDYYRGTVEAVVNAGNLLRFRNWTQKVNMLVHGGVGLSDIKFSSPNTPKDRTVNVVFGITPQIKLTNRVSLFLDVSAVMNLYQETSFSGSPKTSIKGSSEQIFNTSLGLNISLGKNDVHADWYTELDDTESDDNTEETNIGLLEKRLKATETKISQLSDVKNNYDKDGLISELDNRYSKKGDNTNTVKTKADFIKELLNRGYENVYFDFGESSIQKHSLKVVNYLSKYMSENPSAKAEINGYADELGDTISNEILSLERAKRVYDVLIAFGISTDRLSYNGKGEDTSVNKNSEYGRQLVRRVTFTIK